MSSIYIMFHIMQYKVNKQVAGFLFSFQNEHNLGFANDIL